MTFAAVKSEAEAFGHAATQAPQPMQAAASMAPRHRLSEPGWRCASGALPVGAETNPPAAMIRSKALRSTTRSLTTGNARPAKARCRSSSPSREAPHVELARGRGLQRAVRDAVDHQAARAADPLAAVVVERDRLLARSRSSRSLTTSSISRNDMSGLMSRASYRSQTRPSATARLAPHVEGQVHATVLA